MVSEDDLFAVLAHEARRRLLVLCAAFGELCVCELYFSLGLPQAVVSRHLAVARDARLVVARRQGTWMYYRLHPDLPKWVMTVLAGLEAGPSRAIFLADAARLKAMPDRPVPCCP